MSTQTEYRAVIKRDGRVYPHPYTFPKRDVNWGGYFHDIRAHEIVRWEERTISTSGWQACSDAGSDD